MIKYKNDCVGCPPEIGCLGNSCPYRSAPYHFCDRCGEEIEEPIEFEGEELCEECYNAENADDQ